MSTIISPAPHPIRYALLAFSLGLAAASACVADPLSSLGPADGTEHLDDDGTSSGGGTTGTAATDDATVVEATFASELSCGAESTGIVTMRNTGATSWTRQGGYKLGGVDDSDPFVAGDTRIWLDEGDVVPPGAEHSFVIPMTAGTEAGMHTTDWQMVREGVSWFGQTSTAEVAVVCDGSGGAGGGGGSADGPPFNLNAVTWLHTDVSSWPVTTTLSPVTISGNEICLPYDKTNVWPGVVLEPTVTVNGNPWVFVNHNGTWYGATWEWLRVGQTCKAKTSVAGDHIKQDPLKNWTPQSGEELYFMVSALARSASVTNVSERSNIVKVIWP